MASPVTQPPTQSQPAPLTPPTEPQHPSNPSISQIAPPNLPQPLPSHPAISTQDPGTTRRPRDARLIHLILASLGVSAYQERVPLQLLDFAYRYTSSVLSDAVYLQSEGYDSAEGGHAATGRGRGRGGGGGGGGGGAAAAPGAGGGAGGGGGEKEEVSLAALRIAIGSRMQYQYQGSLPKEFLMGLARERNRIGLGVGRGSVVNGAGAADGSAGQVIGGVRLPPEKYCLTGVGWGLKEEWDSEGEDEQELPSMPQGNGIGGHEGADDGGMGMGDEDEEATMEDIFGDDDGGGGGGAGLGGGEDEDMADD